MRICLECQCPLTRLSYTEARDTCVACLTKTRKRSNFKEPLRRLLKRRRSLIAK